MGEYAALEKFITKHGPKLKKSGGKFAKDLSTAGHEAAEGITEYAKARGVDFGKSALREVANHPILTAAASTTAATALATNGHHDDLGDPSEAGRRLAAHKKKKRPYEED